MSVVQKRILFPIREQLLLQRERSHRHRESHNVSCFLEIVLEIAAWTK